MGRDRIALSLRVLGGTLGGDWERERRDTLFLMTAIALAVAPSLVHLPSWCSAGFSVLFLWRLGLVFSGRPLPGRGVRLLTAAACTAGVVAQYNSLLGREAGVALLVLFLGLKLMEMRARRDLFVVIFLCFFLLLTGFFHSQSPWMGASALIALIGLIATLLTLQAGQREVPVSRRLKFAGVLLLQALPVAAALFVLFPRLNAPLWGFTDHAHSARTGMSDTMAPGQISNLASNDEVAFRVQFEGPIPSPGQLYWRGVTLGDFDGKVWRVQRPDLGIPPRPQVTIPDSGSTIRYRMTLEPHGRRWLFALDVPVELPGAAGLAVAVTPEFDTVAANPLIARIRYEAASRPDATIGLNETPLTLQNWLQLPPGYHQRTLELAARWRNEEHDNAALVRRALDMFRREGFRYTLNPPLLSDHAVDRFLFETRAGFCEHYASAFVVLMRALDIPARVVTGYQGAEANPSGDYFIVRQADAHAWAEVWLEGRGWVRIDPTSAVAPDRIERGARAIESLTGLGSGLLPGLADLSWMRHWRLSIDAASNAWNQWVLNYDRGRQQAFLSRLGLDSTDPRELAGVLGILLGLVIGGVALATLRPRGRPDPVQAAYDTFCARVAALGAPRLRDETAYRYLRRIDRLLEATDARCAREIVAVYSSLRYDPESSTPERIRQLQRLVREFKPT